MEQLQDGLWEVRQELALPGGVVFESRMSVIDVGDGELLLHSPVAIDDALGAEVAARGDVRWIVAPNDMHNSWLEQAAQRFPKAEVWATPGTRKKRRALQFAGALEESTPAEWRGRVEAVHVHGTRGWGESVFLLGARRTLVCTDLLFNIQRVPNLRTGLVLRLVGAYRRPAQSASVRWWFTRDRALVGEAFRQILAWDFDRVVMGHGEPLTADAHATLERALGWALPRVTRELAA